MSFGLSLISGSTSSVFNGGRSQAQTWDLGLLADCPFLNLMLTATQWNYNDNQGSPLPSELDSNGYPVATGAHGGYKTIASIFPAASGRSGGTYVLSWSGNGTMSLGVPNTGTITGTSGSLTSTGGSGRYEFTTTSPDSLVVGITSVGSPTITNIKLFFKADESLLNGGQIFGPQFLATLRAGNPGVLRFLDMSNGNSSNVTTWATRKPTTYFSYEASEYRPSLYAGSTTSSGCKYSISFGSGAPVDKQTIHVNFAPNNVTFAGTTVTTATNHGFNVNQPIVFSGFFASASITSTPATSLSQHNGSPTIYWVTSTPTANTFTFSTTKGGANTSVTSSTGTVYVFVYNTPQSVTYSNSGAADVITWANHGLSIGDPVAIQTTNSFGMPSPLWQSQTFYVSATNFTANSFEFSLTPGGAVISTTGQSFSGTFSCFGLSTLNLNGAGAVPISVPWGDPGSGIPFCENTTSTLVYDADLNCWLQRGGNSEASVGLDSKVPPEILVSLCVAIGAHPHFVAPYLTCDPITDWHTQLALYIKNSAPTWMKPRFEGTNETWNPTGGFYATRYAWNKEPAHWGHGFYLEDHNWYGMAISKIGQAVNAVYGGTPNVQTGYAVLCGIQTVTAGGSSNDPRLNCAQWISAGAPVQSGYTISAAYNWATHVAVANYWNPGERDTPQEMIDAFNYAVTNNGNSTAQTTILNSYLSTSNSGCVFTGSLSGGVLTVTAVANGQLAVGALFQNAGSSVQANTTITSFGTGTGGVGTYNVTNAQTLASGTLFTDGVVNGAQASFGNLVTIKRYAQGALSWAQALGAGQVNKMCGYEGGYSPDYLLHDNDSSSAVTSITNATNAVVTLGTYSTLSGSRTGNPGAVGMPICISGVAGMTQINNGNGAGVTVNAGTPGTVTWAAHGFSIGQAIFFEPTDFYGSVIPSGVIFGQAYYVQSVVDANTFTVSATSGGAAINITGTQVGGINAFPCWVITAVSGSTITLNANSTGFGAYSSGGTIVYGATTYLTTTLRRAAKFTPNMQTFTTQLYNDFVAAGGEFPSCYTISGQSVWGVWDPNIYTGTTPPQWAAITAFNH